MTDFERRSVISGIGQSAVGRRLGRSDLDLTLEASLQAIADAGLTTDDVDGIATYPGGNAGMPGFGGPGTPDVQEALRLSLNWHSGGMEGPAQLQAVVNAVMAVGAGLANHVLVYRTVTESTAQGAGGRAGIGIGSGGGGGGGGGFGKGGIPGAFQYLLPFRAYSAANWLALAAQRHFHEYGTSEEQLAMIALNGRRNAEVNPKAIYRDPMSLDDYFASRVITTPFRLFDCDVPVDGSTAVIVSRAEHASAVDHPVARVEAVGTALRGRPSWDQFDDPTTMAARDAGAHLWTRTDLTPADVDVVQLYDGFSFLAMTWLEALGFCGKGESGPFVEGGARIARDGELPLNTHGGQLSAGRLHGFGFIHEACVQLRGEGGDRQVPKDVEVAAVANGGGPIAGCLLLTTRWSGLMDFDDLLACLDLTELEPGVVTGPNLDIGYHRVFGGQILAQLIVAATAASPGKSVKSLTVLFPREGDTSQPLRFHVDKLQDGRTFGTTSITVRQGDEGKVVTAAIVSMHADEDGWQRSDAPPALDPPAASVETDLNMVPWEVRVVGGVDLSDHAAGPPQFDWWTRTPTVSGERDSTAVHQALLAHATDLTVIGTALRPFEGLSQADSTKTMHTAVTGHSMWFHQPFRVDDWLLVTQHSPVVAKGRAYGRGDVFAGDQLVASFAQESMIRPIPQGS